MPARLTRRELATVLAALRYFQQDLVANEDEGPFSPDYFNDKITPLTVAEIDDLCQRLNCGTKMKSTFPLVVNQFIRKDCP